MQNPQTVSYFKKLPAKEGGLKQCMNKEILANRDAMIIVCIVFTTLPFFRADASIEEFSTYRKQTPATWLKINQHN